MSTSTWRTITAEEVFSAEERAQSDVLANAGATIEGVLQRVVGGCRESVRAGGNKVDLRPGTIPDQLREEVIAIAAWRSLMKLPGLDALMTKQRESAYDDAIKRMDLVASNDPNRPRIGRPPNSVAVVPGRKVKTTSFDKLAST